MKLSSTVTPCPFASSSGTRTEPRYPAPPVTRMFTPTPLQPPDPCTGPIGNGFADAAFVEDARRRLKREFGVGRDEFLGGCRGVVPRPARLATRHVVEIEHDAVGGDDVRAFGHQRRVNVELGAHRA